MLPLTDVQRAEGKPRQITLVAGWDYTFGGARAGAWGNRAPGQRLGPATTATATVAPCSLCRALLARPEAGHVRDALRRRSERKLPVRGIRVLPLPQIRPRTPLPSRWRRRLELISCSRSSSRAASVTTPLGELVTDGQQLRVLADGQAPVAAALFGEPGFRSARQA